jgi:hypothetical protein
VFRWQDDLNALLTAYDRELPTARSCLARPQPR